MNKIIAIVALVSSISVFAYDHTYNGFDENGDICSLHIKELNSKRAKVNIYTKNVKLSKTVKMDDKKIKFNVDTEIGSYPNTTNIDSKVRIKLEDSRPISFKLKAKVISKQYVYIQKEEISVDYARARLGLPKRDVDKYSIECELN